MPKVPTRIMPAFTDDQALRLLHGIDRKTNVGLRNYAMILLLLDTGIRVSELVGLEMQDLHIHEGFFKVWGKGGKERIVPLGLTTQKVVWKYIRKHRPEPQLPTLDKVFLSRSGLPISTQWVYKIMARASRKAGIRGVRAGPHTCRHTFARNFLANGGGLLTLQGILGHSSLEVVKLYVHLRTDDLVLQQRRYSPVDAMRLGT